MRILVSAILVATLVAPLSVATDASRAVTIASFEFEPSPLFAETGDRVTFTNEDSAPHTATCSAGCSFDTGTISNGQSASVTLAGVGTQSYFCAIHPSMLGSIYVGTTLASSPDLVPDAASVRGGRGALVDPLPHPLVGELRADVANAGGSAAGATTVEFLRVDPATGDRVRVGVADLPALQPGASATVRVAWSGAPLVGTAEVIVVVDPANAVVERTESDNVASAVVQIGLL